MINLGLQIFLTISDLWLFVAGMERNGLLIVGIFVYLLALSSGRGIS